MPSYVTCDKGSKNFIFEIPNFTLLFHYSTFMGAAATIEGRLQVRFLSLAGFWLRKNEVHFCFVFFLGGGNLVFCGAERD